MNDNERMLFDGALRSVKTLVLHGLVSSEAEVLDALTALRGGYETIDLRAARSGDDAPRLRSELKEHLAKQPTVVMLLGASIPKGVQEVLEEVTAGVLKLDPDAPEKVADDARVVALSPEKELASEVARPFGLQISGMRVIEEQRAAIRRAEEELRVAQERARESSRRHGLV